MRMSPSDDVYRVEWGQVYILLYAGNMALSIGNARLVVATFIFTLLTECVCLCVCVCVCVGGGGEKKG